VPVFAVYGDNDRLVPPDKNIALLKQGLEAAGNHRYQIYTIPGPGVNHSFKPSDFGTPEKDLQAIETSADFLEVMKKFVIWEQEIHNSK